MIIYVNDKMQKNYNYELVCEEGKDFAPDFTPELTPPEMLHMGVFEGHYLNDCQNEFPSHWFKETRLSESKANASINYFHIESRLSLTEWQKRGWFQWYCRYYYGRRLPEIDKIQIKRWKAFKRHKVQIIKNCYIGDLGCRAKQHQALLQWAYNPLF